MKRFMVIALLITVFSATIFSLSVVMAEFAFPPHEDPAIAESIIDAPSLLTYYTSIFAFTSLRDYENANRLIEELKFVYVPEDLKFIVQRYNDLTLELIGVLDELEELLDKASTLLYQYRLNEAYQVLDSAGILLRKAEILLKDIREATETLSNRLGVFAAPAKSKIREAYNRLEDVLRRLDELINEYTKLLKNIRNETLEIRRKELKPTEITLNLNTTRVFVGECVEAFGVLTSGGEKLQNRTITILLDGERVTEAVTGLDGSYYALVRIPYRYVHIMTVKALYTPLGNDRGIYLASSSAPIPIEVLFYETNLEITVPDTAYPGLPITVKGKTVSSGYVSTGERRVKVLLDGAPLADTTTSIEGLFEVEITPNLRTPTGKHTLTAKVEPKGVYAGASRDRTLNIVKVQPEMKVHSPLVIFLPANVPINGTVYSRFGPLKGAVVTLRLGNTFTVARTSKSGDFNSTLQVPLDLILVGFHKLNVAVEPSEPWHSSAKKEISMFVVNPANIGLTSVASISFGALLYTRLLRVKRERKQIEAIQIMPMPKEPAAAFPLKPRANLKGVKGRILKAYLRAVQIVEEKTNTPMRPHMTLREFLTETRIKLKGAADAFNNLTVLAEKALYSPYVLGVNEALKAEKLVLSVVRALGG